VTESKKRKRGDAYRAPPEVRAAIHAGNPWSKEPPAKPGWYWAIIHDSTGPEVIRWEHSEAHEGMLAHGTYDGSVSPENVKLWGLRLAVPAGVVIK
jgi:hypothetical protein